MIVIFRKYLDIITNFCSFGSNIEWMLFVDKVLLDFEIKQLLCAYATHSVKLLKFVLNSFKYSSGNILYDETSHNFNNVNIDVFFEELM